MSRLEGLVHEHILVLDGATGTMMRQYNLTEGDFRGERFAQIPRQLKGNNDIPCLTHPDVIRDIHRRYLATDAGIIETDTFSSTNVSMADYHMQDYVREINLATVKLAREVVDKFAALTPGKPRLVAGSVGPTNRTCSMSPDVNNPAFRALTYDELVMAYYERMEAALEAGVDALLIETIFDTLNAKATTYATKQAMSAAGIRAPLMLSITVFDIAGHTLLEQTLDAFLASVQHTDIFSVELNCPFGARQLKPFLEQLAARAPYYVSAYPNAGLPNSLSTYDQTPVEMAAEIKEYIHEGLVNIIGGCCGTIDEYIAAYSFLVDGVVLRMPVGKPDCLWLSGLELLEVRSENNFVSVGERCNVTDSRKFLRLVNEKRYDKALGVARQQVEDDARIIDISMNDGLLDAGQEVAAFLRLIASEPEITHVPVVVDSSERDVIVAGPRCVQGKSVVNSISLKEGEEMFLEHARTTKEYGAATIVMAFNERGQADTYECEIEVCERAYRLLVGKVGLNPHDIVFDPNMLAVATGMDEHNNYAVDFIRATDWIRKNLPGAYISNGASNLSFSFRGNNYIREAMHAAFLYHAIREGMDMSIVNPTTSVLYTDIPTDILERIEDVVLNRRADAVERLIETAERLRAETDAVKVSASNGDSQLSASGSWFQWREGMVEECLKHTLTKGVGDCLEEDLVEALNAYPKAVDTIESPLMTGINYIGDLFGAGRAFLPQVVKTAHTMRKAVAILQPIIESEKQAGTASAGRVLLATVKGDVHDIGRNIVAVIMACNGYEIIDLGVTVPTETIVQHTIEEKADMIGLSGLITSSLGEVMHVAMELEEAGLDIPLLVSGVTVSPLHTALKIASVYHTPVVHLKDAPQSASIAARLINPSQKEELAKSLFTEYQRLRGKNQERQVKTVSLEEAKASRLKLF